MVGAKYCPVEALEFLVFGTVLPEVSDFELLVLRNLLGLPMTKNKTPQRKSLPYDEDEDTNESVVDSD